MKKLLDAIVRKLPLIYTVLAVSVTITLILVIFPQEKTGEHYDYAVGGFWSSNDLYAPFDFAVLKSQSEVDKEVAAARSKSILYYSIDSTAVGATHANLGRLHLTPNEVRTLRGIVAKVFERGYLEVPAGEESLEGRTIVVLDGNVGSEHTADDFVTPWSLNEIVAANTHGDAEARRMMRLLTDSILKADLRYESNRTQLELESRLSQISYTSDMLTKGELIIAKGALVTEEKAQVIASLEHENEARSEQDYNKANHNLGNFLLCLIAFVALYVFLKTTNHEILNDRRKVNFVFTLVLMMALITSAIVRYNPDYVLLAPLCIAPILMRVFFDMRVALYIHLTIVIILGNLVPNSFEFIFYQLITGIMSIISVKNFDRRSNFLLVSLVIFLTYSLIYTAGILSQDTSLAHVDPGRYSIFFLNAVLTLLASPLILLFERLFGMTTDLSLLEIASTNTPALRELSRKAPGTFQHSMQVANISEDLINEIGGNPLLARVGGLYHDIGKTNAPLYFTENQNTHFNPHDNLDYEESARVITQHVRDGISLAKKYRLPNCVTEFIRTHHGTTKTGYFYAKYRQEHPDEEVDVNAFQYAGPTPFSRETAVVMLVDSVEAACKSLKEPTKENIYRLVDSIVRGKIDEGQLNNCDITFADISKITSMLKDKMLSIYHVRIAYPTREKEEKK